MTEPIVEGWRAVPIGAFADMVRRHVDAPAGRPPVLAVDGRSSGGKTTLADRLATVMPGTVVVHTDDVARGLRLGGPARGGRAGARATWCGGVLPAAEMG